MMKENKAYFVGAGPGDPDLITVKGLKLLQQADVILYTDSLIHPSLLDRVKKGAKTIKTSGLTLEQQIEMIVEEIQKGSLVVRLHTGDPSIFSTTSEQMRRLQREGIDYEIIPGVSSVFAAAAQIKAELTIPELTQTLIITRIEGRTPVPEKEKLRELARHHSTLALFLSSSFIGKVVEELRFAGWAEDTPIVVVYRATWEDQKIIQSTLAKVVEELKKENIHSHAMILAGNVFQNHLDIDKNRSKLYDGRFSHGYRKGE
ncbi:precorrin-4 C(11)-methyltransferase [Tepidibacillus fermentans]|uniref:Precorrin-4/cobalt-precorrin-4 C11-methyltransferase n=1 Tax=Tepidibacillus fermentans TaxID=1281767 RepID=A0A4V2US38_9BACI|nr:precorrin-4 C(11)-methyltransferase [Tepidibacillus fermentans]TCS79922.1 precorrin-4/cobalt-precorrin-4 C11-methyltransferase [Tepidibacillus fermentans]